MRRLLIVLFSFALFLPLETTAAAEAPKLMEPWKAVSYTERPESGPLKNGRRLSTAGGAYYGIDINSRVDIDLDAAKLSETFESMEGESEKANRLKRRLKLLSSAVKSLGSAYAEMSNDLDPSRERNLRLQGERVRETEEKMDRWYRDIFNKMSQLQPATLEFQGIRRPAAEDISRNSLEEVSPEKKDWLRLRSLIAGEIEAADRDLDAHLREAGVSMEIQAHLLTADGPIAMPLPGWNSEAPGARRPVVKVPSLTEEAVELKEEVEATNRSGEQVANEADRLPRGNAAMASSEIRSMVAAGATPLPVPKDQRQILVGQVPPRTHFDLTTLSAVPKPGSYVQVRYKFFADGKETNLTWVDTFVVESYGWKDATFGSLAFAQQDKKEDNTWKPSATFSWLLDFSKWPEKDSDFGLRSVNSIDFFSAGLSVMELDFDSEKEIEVGFAITLATLNNRVLMGYGKNFQVDKDSGYWFFAVRLFEGQGIIEKLKPKKQTSGGSSGGAQGNQGGG